MTLPLEGIVVVSVEQAVAAPFASRQLADLGARVIKIERPGSGDFARDYDHAVNGLSAHFVWLNRSKESLAVDLKDPAGRRVIHRLVDRADVFVQNLAPGAADRLGLGADELRSTRPRLITCDVSGYGDGGPYRQRRAYDLLIQSEVGLLSVTGSPDAPARAGISVADIAAGMYAFSGVLSALYERERTGVGRRVHVSLFDSLAEWMGFPFYYGRYGPTPLPRAGAAHAGIAPYGPFRTGDGGTVVMAVQNDREWVRFTEVVLGEPALATDPRYATNSARVTHRSVLGERIEERFADLTTDATEDLLEAARIGHARMNDVNNLDSHPQVVGRGRLRQIDSPVGPLCALEPPTTDGHRPALMGPVPTVGEHGRAVLRWVGYSVEEIESLVRDGVVDCAPEPPAGGVPGLPGEAPGELDGGSR
ncbi:MAG TPA: CaiB/BaiF CoA-transferase family protein [Mycobacteriales bacterium]